MDERFEKTNDLDREVKRDDLIYRCKGNTSDLNFNEFDSGVDIINNICDSKQYLSDVKIINIILKDF